MLSFFFNAFQSAPRNGIDNSLRSGGNKELMNNSVTISASNYKYFKIGHYVQLYICYSPTASVLVLLAFLVSPINVSNSVRLAIGLLWTSRAPALARSRDVPLCNAVFNHFTSDGLRFWKPASSASKHCLQMFVSSVISASFISNNSSFVLNVAY